MNEMTASDIRATANDRIATCDIYINRRAMVRHNTVIVSSIYNGRGLQLGEPNADGSQESFITVFPKGMPTCFTPDDAAELVEEMNAHLAEQGADERVRAVPAREWWKAEKEHAQGILDFIAKNEAALNATAEARSPAPTRNIGDWIFNPVSGRNERIVEIIWDDTLHGHTGGWRYWVPGYGSPDPLPEIESQPYYTRCRGGAA